MGGRDAIEHEIVYPFRIDDVWEALTNPVQLAAWLMENDFTAGVGSHFTFFDHEPWPDGRIYDVVCDVLEFDPPHRLTYTWGSPPKLGRTVVEWELSELASGTRVRLRHSGFAAHGDAGREALDLHQDGWGGLLREELAQHLNTLGTPIISSSRLKMTYNDKRIRDDRTRRDRHDPDLSSDQLPCDSDRRAVLVNDRKADVITNIDAISVAVSDQEEALTYYRDILGFDIRMDDMMGNGMRFLMVAPPDGQTGIVLFPAGGDAQPGGSFGTVFATRDCRATHADLAAKGVSFSEEPAVQEWGGVQAQFSDPDGNHFVLVELPEHMKGESPA